MANGHVITQTKINTTRNMNNKIEYTFLKLMQSLWNSNITVIDVERGICDFVNRGNIIRSIWKK